MYTIRVDGRLLYTPFSDDHAYSVISPVLTKERGRAGTLEFVMPKCNKEYNGIQKLTSRISVFDGQEEIFRGRCTNSNRRLSEQKKISCEGSLSFLNDTVSRPFLHKKTTLHAEFRSLIENHNAKVSDDRKFILGYMTVPDEYIEEISSDDYLKTIRIIQDKLCDVYGGYLSVRYSNGKMYLDYILEGTETCDQTIEFGHNMLDLTEYISAEDVYTCIIPLGDKVQEESTDAAESTASENEEEEDSGSKTTGTSNRRLTIRSVNNDIDNLVSQPGVLLFGLIEKVVIFEDVKDPNELLARGSLKLRNAFEQSIGIELRAIDMHSLNIETERIDEGKNVQVISRPHGIDQIFPCTKVVRYLAEPDKDNYTFGNVRKTLSAKVSKRM